MKTPISNKKKNLILSVAMSSLIVLSIGVSSFAYWTKQEGNFNIPTTGFNATEDEFTYYACIPNVASEYGYDYYDVSSIPSDLTDRITGLAAVRFEALTKTCYVPSYPKVTIDGKKYNSGDSKELPVIHILKSLSYDDIAINNGYSKVETLIIPETVTFIQPGSFATSTNLKEVSFLGNTENSGYICIDENEFVRYADDDTNKENNLITVRYESSHRKSNDYLYMLKDYSYKYTQFSGEFEYDNLSGVYTTFVVPSTNIASGSQIIEGIELTSTKDMKADTKYKISFDGTAITIDEYTYKLSYSGLDTPIDLVLNTNAHFEEYIIPSSINGVSTLNTIRINNYPEISVDEYINGEINTSIESTFELANLNASYSKDNYAFEIKYAPSYTYESIHYYTDSSDELVDVTTLTQISVEKAYFLNCVKYTTYEVTGEKVRTITVPDDDYLSLYVKAKYYDNKDESLKDIYFVDPKDASGTNTYVEMSENGDSWTFQFSSNNAPEKIATAYGTTDSLKQYLVPNSFTFYQGKYSVVSYPSYTSSATTETEIQSALVNETYDTTRVYLDMAIGNDTATAFYEDDHYGTDGDIKYHWYLVYWDDQGKQGSFRIYYADYDSTMLIADVPNIAAKFKFARIAASDNIETATSGNWEGVVNQIENDLTFEANFSESNCIKWTGWYENGNGRFTYTNTTNVTSTNLLLRNRNYLVIQNYGENGNEKYISLDENLGYGDKDIDSSINKLEFTKYSNYETRAIQSIALSEGAIVKAKIFNINTAEYFAGYYGKSSVTGTNALGFKVQNSKSKDINVSEYFDFTDEGYLVVKKDCQIEFYIKVNYDKENKTISDYGWYIKVIADKLPGFSREVVVDTNASFTGNSTNYTSNTKTFDMTYPLLDQTGTVYKLVRNYSNTQYEEYYYHTVDPDSTDNKKYVISPYYENDRNFAANTGSIYYGVIGDTPTGETYIDNNYDLVLFTPNEEGGYSTRQFAVYDEYDNLLTYLSYNSTQSVNEGYQCFSFVVPQALNDYKEVYIYEVDSNGNILNKDSGPLNVITNLDDIRKMYNNVNNTSITYNKNDLVYDYYLQIDDVLEFNSNNSGFSYSEVDGDYKVYYFDDMYISSSNKYQIYNNDATSTNLALSNTSSPLEEQIIDGYYYTGLTLSSSDKSFTLPDGYYDLALRVKGSSYYLGYKYLGDTAPYEEGYTLHLYDNGEEVDVIPFNATYNKNNYFADVVVSKNYTFKIYDSLDMLVTGGVGELTYSSSGINVARIYFSNNYPFVIDESTSKVFVETLSGIELIYNFGEHPTMYDYDEDGEKDYVNIRYSPVMYVPSGNSFVNKIVVKNITNPYLHILDENGESTIKQYFETISEKEYGSYLVVTGFDVDVKIVIGTTQKGLINIPQPGKYYISYNTKTEVVSCSKVQDSDRLFVVLDDEVIANLDVSSTTVNYYEYVVKDHIILYEDINLVVEEGTPNILLIKDNLGNTVSSIDRVTLNGKSVNIIPAGVYSLTYSVDSSRRVEDKYLVFTYLNFNTIPSSTITYHYETSDGVEGTSIRWAVTSNENTTWYYTLEDYKALSSYVPQGMYFVGWTTTENGTSIISNTLTIEANMDLYPVFEERSKEQEVIWLSDLNFDSTSDIIFTLDNLENCKITEVTHESISTTSYIDIVDNRVYVNPSLFERIGYVEGGIPLLVHIKSLLDNDEYSTQILIPYPRYENGTNSVNSYATSFTSSEYPASSSTSVYTKTITALIDTAVSWNVEDANITTHQSYGSESDSTDMSLRLKAGASNSIIGKATTDTLFTKIVDIEFNMYTQAEYAKTTLYVVLVDVNGNELFRSNAISNSTNADYESINVSINISGVYFIRFEVETSAVNNTFVHVDNVKFVQGRGSYSTNFSSDEYDINSEFVTNDDGIIGKTSSIVSWDTVDAKIQNDQYYGEDGLALSLRKNTSSGEDGSIISTNKFINVKSVSFKMMVVSGYTKISISVSIINEQGEIFLSSTNAKASENSTWTDLIYETDETVVGYLKISISVSSPAESTKYVSNIDNLVITCS